MSSTQLLTLNYLTKLKVCIVSYGLSFFLLCFMTQVLAKLTNHSAHTERHENFIYCRMMDVFT